MFYKKENNEHQTKLAKKVAQKILGDGLYFDLLEIKEETMLDKTLFGFFERCFKINKVIPKHGLFLKLFERRNMYRLFIKKRFKEKMRWQEIFLLAYLKSLMVTRK